jgi:hypothetical protein
MDAKFTHMEDMIIRLLEAKLTRGAEWTDLGNAAPYHLKNRSDGRMVETDIGVLLQAEPMVPHRAHTFDATDPDRMIAINHELLMAHPADILGAEAEAAMIYGNTLKWLGFRRLKERPKRVACGEMGKHTYYELHFRTFTDVYDRSDNTLDTVTTSSTRVAAFNKSGACIPVFYNGRHQLCGKGEIMSSIMCCSLIEDSKRVDSYLVELQDAVTLLFPVGVEAAFDLFAMREAPLTPSGRRRALAHWVSSHMRHVSVEKSTPVREHYRGVREFTMDGINVTITPNNLAWKP